MSADKKTSDRFHDVRSGFDHLEVDEQARFLVEAALSLVANGAREAGNVVQTVVDDLVESIKREAAAEAEEPAPEPKPKAKPRAKRTTKPRSTGTRKKPQSQDPT